jgi:hypothetical protein
VQIHSVRYRPARLSGIRQIDTLFETAKVVPVGPAEPRQDVHSPANQLRLGDHLGS